MLNPCRYSWFIIWLITLVAGVVLLIQALWFLDFAIWYNHTYMYLPFIAWGVKFNKGDAVNIAYWEIITSLIIILISTIQLARTLFLLKYGFCKR